MSSDSGRARLALAAILACGAALRFWALGAGIPYSIGVDEPQVLNRSLTMMRTGDYNPYFYDYPTLYIYAQLALASVRFMAGALAGYWGSLADAHLPDFVLWGRALTASIGTLTIYLVYRIGRRWSVRHGLLAGGLMAFMPMHVRESHFILTDVPLTFFVTLTLLVTLRAAERPHARMFALAGAAAGLAAATKYPGALSLIMPLIAARMTTEARPSRLAAAAAAVGGSAAAFLLAAPYTLLDLPGFLNGFGNLMVTYTGAPPARPGWEVYLKHLRTGLGWPAFIAMAAGLVLGVVRAVRGPSRLLWVLTIVLPVLYFAFLSRQSLIFGRYLLPILPFACLLAASAVLAASAALPQTPHRRQLRIAMIALLTAFVTIPPAVAAVAWDRRQAQRGTAALAYEWIHANVPPGTSITVEGTDLVLSYSEYQGRAISQLRHRTAADYARDGVQYLVASSQCYGPYLERPKAFAGPYRDYMTLFSLTQEVARFSPSAEHPGPELRILKVMP